MTSSNSKHQTSAQTLDQSTSNELDEHQDDQFELESDKVKFEKLTRFLVNYPLQIRVMRFIQDHFQRLLPLFTAIHFLGKRDMSLLLLPMTIYLYLPYEKGLRLCFYSSLATQVVVLLKDVLCVPRPKWLFLTQLRSQSWVKERSYATPSAHASSFASSSVIFAWYYPGPLTACLCVASVVLTSISRMYFAVHYLQDVILGSILGVSIPLIMLSFDPLQYALVSPGGCLVAAAVVIVWYSFWTNLVSSNVASHMLDDFPFACQKVLFDTFPHLGSVTGLRLRRKESTLLETSLENVPYLKKGMLEIDEDDDDEIIAIDNQHIPETEYLAGNVSDTSSCEGDAIESVIIKDISTTISETLFGKSESQQSHELRNADEEAFEPEMLVREYSRASEVAVPCRSFRKQYYHMALNATLFIGLALKGWCIPEMEIYESHVPIAFTLFAIMGNATIHLLFIVVLSKRISGSSSIYAQDLKRLCLYGHYVSIALWTIFLFPIYYHTFRV